MISKGGIKALLSFYVPTGLFFIFLASWLMLRGLGAQGQDMPAILINEVAWMGTASSSNAEWIELKNGADTEIDLSGWTLKAADGTPDIALSGKIASSSFYLLERTNDQTVSTVVADQVYPGALSNSNETLSLFDKSGVLIDSVIATSSWPGGNNTTKQTMERADDGSWLSSLIPEGTPRATNSVSALLSGNATGTTPVEASSTATTTPETVENSNASTSPSTVSSASSASNGSSLDLVINEILPNPKGNDALGEYIELLNVGFTAIDITGWRVVVGEKQYIIAPNSTRSNFLNPGGLTVLWRSETKLVLPNDRGQLFLFSPESGTQRQSLSYEQPAEGRSYDRNDVGGWIWSETPTPGEINAVVAVNLPP
ncbi:lamin tail domain-containing protein, partial [Candidatus Falkowbacteria bacterium]|nr:lamin tail domain-containing protein [Candidatus Falkowbacteria bacterium]